MNAPTAATELAPALPPDVPVDRRQRQTQVVTALTPLLPAHALLWQREDTVPYECDGLTAYREMPLAVALPETEAQLAAVLAACHRLGVPVVARGAGTGLSGGATPHTLGVTLSLAKFNKIIKVDPVSRTAIVQSGVDISHFLMCHAAGVYAMLGRKMCRRLRSIAPTASWSPS